MPKRYTNPSFFFINFLGTENKLIAQSFTQTRSRRHDTNSLSN